MRRKMTRNKITIIIFAVFMIGLMMMPTMSVTKVDLLHVLEGPSKEHWLGTDNLGKDLFSLMVNGCIRSLVVVGSATVISLTLGASLGLLAGYYGGIVSTIIQFISDFTLVVPSFIAALVFTSIFGFSPLKVGIILGIMGIGEYVNQMDILTRQIRSQEYILAEHIIGIKDLKIIFKHILPNLSNSLLTFMGNRASNVILSYAGLAYIGLGADATNPDWGTMIYNYRSYLIHYPRLVLWPTLGIFVLALFFHLMFDNKEPERRGGIYE